MKNANNLDLINHSFEIQAIALSKTHQTALRKGK